MNTVTTNTNNSATIANYGAGQDIIKRLPWSVALAAIPFIPDILDAIKSIPDQMARNGYALHVKHGQTEIHFNRADRVGESMEGGTENAQNG